MAHIAGPGAGQFSEFAFTSTAVTTTPDGQTAYEALTYTDVGRVNTFPAVGTPANITNLPQFGQSTSVQIQGQADAPSLEFTLNWTGSDHTAIQALAGDQITRAFRTRIANAELPDTLLAGTEHDDFYWTGTIAAVVVTPGLQGNSATLTVTAISSFEGPFTTA